MHTFLSKVLEDVLAREDELSGHCFVLPNKRSALFLKNELIRQLSPYSFFPSILSIEEFMERLSGCQVLDRIGLLFEFYSVFKTSSGRSDQESFESFSKWAHVLLQDFNELDANLTDAESILQYIHEARRIENWATDGAQSKLVKSYLDFHRLIPMYYKGMKERMESMRAGYQGHVYRQAWQALQREERELFASQFVFAGFNALSRSEEKVMRALLERDRARVYWDDDLFYEATESPAGSFLSSYRKTWPYYRSNDFTWAENNIDSPKVIHLHGLPKHISQVKHAGSLLKALSQEGELNNTALILGNEKLLPVLLNSLPPEVGEANVTMGYELQNVALSTFFESLFRLHLNQSGKGESRGFYYRDLQRLTGDPQLKKHFREDPDFQANWDRLLFRDKLLFFSEQDLFGMIGEGSGLNELFSLLFTGWDDDINVIVNKLLSLINWLRQENEPDRLELEILFRFHGIFTQLLNFNRSYGHIETLKALHQFYRQILQMEKMSFQGEPLSGLQIMGLLESRVLDFENVILTSVNEGFLPAGRSGNSFIPVDIKAEKDLPTFREKEAIFNYHFLRLLHRAKRVYLVYNNITDDFGSGEPSRFLKQLEVAKKLGLLDKVRFEKKSFQPLLTQRPLALKSVPKNSAVIDKLREISLSGFSPTALTTYVRNPLDYYKRYILGIEEYEQVEESMAANTFGTVIHNTLEALYKPLLGQFLQPAHVEEMLKKIDEEIEVQWSRTYSSRAGRTGKNYLSFEIAKQFMVTFLKGEKSLLEKGKRIRILALEEKVSRLHHPEGFDAPVRLKGTIDRVDEVDGVLRILDYKTGKVTSSDMSVKNWPDLITDEKNSKAFQVLMYAYLYSADRLPAIGPAAEFESGIISFKNLNGGFMSVNSAPVNEEVLEEFVLQLDRLLSELFDPALNFEEKELKTYGY